MGKLEMGERSEVVDEQVWFGSGWLWLWLVQVVR